MAGKKFGRWTVWGPAAERAPSGLLKWECRCECGTLAVVVGAALRSGTSSSCGCLAAEMLSKRTRHDIPSYGAMHFRIGKALGRARECLCPCGAVAQYWAYDHTDSNELREVITDGRTGNTREVGYSMDPTRYVALCHSCHTSFDRLNANGKVATWKKV